MRAKQRALKIVIDAFEAQGYKHIKVKYLPEWLIFKAPGNGHYVRFHMDDPGPLLSGNWPVPHPYTPDPGWSQYP